MRCEVSKHKNLHEGMEFPLEVYLSGGEHLIAISGRQVMLKVTRKLDC